MRLSVNWILPPVLILIFYLLRFVKYTLFFFYFIKFCVVLFTLPSLSDLAVPTVKESRPSATYWARSGRTKCAIKCIWRNILEWCDYSRLAPIVSDLVIISKLFLCRVSSRSFHRVLCYLRCRVSSRSRCRAVAFLLANSLRSRVLSRLRLAYRLVFVSRITRSLYFVYRSVFVWVIYSPFHVLSSLHHCVTFGFSNFIIVDGLSSDSTIPEATPTSQVIMIFVE